jgi:hypothetical protein
LQSIDKKIHNCREKRADLQKKSYMNKVFLIVFMSFLAVLSTVSFGCKSKKAAVAAADQVGLVWGSGGGITGKVTSYKLLESGNITRSMGVDGSTTDIKPIKAKVAKAMFSAAKDLSLAEVAQNTPGNMYYFLELVVDGKTNRITWGEAGTEVPSKVKDFYQLLNQLVLKGTK